MKFEYCTAVIHVIFCNCLTLKFVNQYKGCDMKSEMRGDDLKKANKNNNLA